MTRNKRIKEHKEKNIKGNYKENSIKHEYPLVRRDRSKKEAIISKGGKCEICGYKYDGENAICFDFHHINPKEKRYNPSTALRLSKEERDIELSKCLLVCANCHRLIHAKKNQRNDK